MNGSTKKLRYQKQAEHNLPATHISSTSANWPQPGAFAAILADGSVVSWGSASFGGDSREVQDKLSDLANEVLFSYWSLGLGLLEIKFFAAYTGFS